MSASLQRSMQSVRRLASRRPERCELCAAGVASRHQHLLEPKIRELTCVCDACAVLFDSGPATKYRRVPREVVLLSGLQLDSDEWSRLLVPIGLVFFYRSSHAGAVVALYPSPGGLTETVVEPEAWGPIAAMHPRLEALREDVEALLVHRLKGSRDYFVAPIDRCFELAGLVRKHWRGFSGGDRVWEEVSGFVAGLRGEAR